MSTTNSASQNLTELLAKANKENPAPKDVQALELHYVKYPPATWKIGIAALAVESALEGIKNGAIAESTRAGIRKLRGELGYATAPPLERIVIDHLELCWLNVHHIQCKYDMMMARSLTLNQANYWERRLTTAQLRFLRAVEMLARIRRLKLPALQLNVAENQVNIAT